MADQINLNTAGIGALLCLVVTALIWMAKSQRAEAVDVKKTADENVLAASLRADEAVQAANQKVIDFMEKRQEEDSRWRDTQAAAILELAQAVTGNTASLDKHTAMLQPLVETMHTMACSVQMLVEDHRKDMDQMIRDFRDHGSR